MNTAIFSTDDKKLVESIINCKSNKIKPKLIITNKPNSSVIDIAKQYNIKHMCFDHKKHHDRVSHEKEIIRHLKEENIQLVVFAHYMRLITKYFVDRYRNRILNIHPSLLPNFKGANGYLDAFNAGARESGCTVHYVDEGLDTGDIILQKSVPRFEHDSFEAFRNRVHDIECFTIQSVLCSMVV